MTNSWGRIPETPVPPQPRRRTGLIVGAVVAAVAAVALVAVGGWYFLRGTDDDGDRSTAQAFTAVPTSPISSSSAPEARAVDTVTVTAEPEPEPESAAEPESESSAGASHGHSGGGLRCDGRNVLVVTSVMSNSPSFDQEVDTALAANPGAVVLAPGTCASLRPEVDGAGVYAVVVDYGDDVDGLCSAEASGRGNSRVLDNEASYRSPC